MQLSGSVVHLFAFRKLNKPSNILVNHPLTVSSEIAQFISLSGPTTLTPKRSDLANRTGDASIMHFITIFWLIEGSNGIVLLLVARKIRSMIIAFQLTFFALIVTSSILWIVYFVFA